MTNNKYTDNLADLDIDITVPKGWNLVLFANNNYRKLEFQKGSGDSRIVILSYYNNCGSVCLYPGKIYCWTFKENSYGEKICKSFARTKGYSTDKESRWVF